MTSWNDVGPISVSAGIMLASQDAIDVAVEEWLATQCITIGIEVLRDGAGAHRLAVQTEGGQLVDKADNRRFLLTSTNRGSNGNGRRLDKEGNYIGNYSPVHVMELPA